MRGCTDAFKVTMRGICRYIKLLRQKGNDHTHNKQHSQINDSFILVLEKKLFFGGQIAIG